ncbi:methionyl-tRNA formyltransferase [Vibrio cholerae]|uniref:formyltransferase family protein n=2 Tax=Vibrio cholerae TaxID=666 RepID=UPI002272125C|nr:formyltransferase family protein [Vibrio cholerae]MCX9515082.1 methionyl-tRNA formyltransferase [Vibrio cholerae]
MNNTLGFLTMPKFGFYLMGEKGYNSLLKLLDHVDASNISFVVTARDLNVKKDFYCEIFRLCEERNVLCFDRSSSIVLDADYFFAISWRWLIKSHENLIVFHDSLLPKYRGFAPLVNALVNGENNIGVTALFADGKYDTGGIIAQLSISVEYPIKIQDAIQKVSCLYSELLINIAKCILNNSTLVCHVQDESQATYSPWRDKNDYFINWYDSSEKISRFVDATGYPYLGSKTKIDADVINISEVSVVQDVVVENRSNHIGKVLFIDNDCPVVICGSGLLKITAMSDSNGRSLIGEMPFRTRFGK